MKSFLKRFLKIKLIFDSLIIKPQYTPIIMGLCLRLTTGAKVNVCNLYSYVTEYMKVKYRNEVNMCDKI